MHYAVYCLNYSAVIHSLKTLIKGIHIRLKTLINNKQKKSGTIVFLNKHNLGNPVIIIETKQ
jgi:hypothetical protein